ncbi:MAG: hypothetical protein U1D30_09205 [Planctomycetota bacterium]
MSEVHEQVGDQVFENPQSPAGNPIYYFLGGIGLIAVAILGFISVLGAKHSQMALQLRTTLPMLMALGMIARGFSLRNLPTRIVVGLNELEIATKRWKRRYAWSEIGSASTTNVFNSPKTCLRITDLAGKTIIRVDESFPDYQKLVKWMEFYVDAKPDDTSLRIMSRKAKWLGLGSFVLGAFLGTAAIYIAMETQEIQRANELLPVKGVRAEGEIVRHYIAPNGVTKRIHYRIADSKVRNVEVDPLYWEELAGAKTVPVIYIPDEPDISRLERGEVTDDDYMKTPTGGYLFASLGALMALTFLVFSPFAWMGYDLGYDDKQRTWTLKRYGRVVWASKKGVL